MNVEGDSFNITDIQEDQLILEYGGRQQKFEQEGHQFKISYEALQKVLTKKNEPLIFQTAEGQPYIVEGQLVEGFKAGRIVKGKATYTLYVNEKRELCVIYNKKPSILNFYHGACRYQGATVENDVLNIHVNFTTVHYKPVSIKGKIKVRNKDTEVISTGIVHQIQQNQDVYEVTASLVFDLVAIRKLLGDTIPFYTYNSDIYDIRFNFQIEDMPISQFYPKVKFPVEDKYKWHDEHWMSLDEHFKLLCRPYPTMSGNLAMRLIPIPMATYEDYTKGQIKRLNQNGKKNIVCIEYPEKAQENGMILFKWLVKHYQKKFNIYYMVSSESKDLANLTGYEAQMIYYKSPENLALMREVDVICHTHMSEYVLPFITNQTEKYVEKPHRVFLQHGIIGSKDVSNLYGRKAHDRIADLFVVSSYREQALIHRDYGFNKDEIIVTGLPRFDNVINERRKYIKKYRHRKKVLVMPTWRQGLNIYDDERFIQTDYYQEFQSLINHEKLKEMVEQHGYEVAFYLHRNFQKFSHLFHSDYVEILSDRDYDVKDLLADYQVLVTDYSSVGLDFALMHKKVVYFRPAHILGKDYVLEPKALLPGEVVTSQDALIQTLQHTAMSKVYRQNLKQLYEYADRRACQRIAQAMIQRFSLKD